MFSQKTLSFSKKLCYISHAKKQSFEKAELLMNNKEFEYILAIAQEKSLSKAAEKLYITQPALSLFLARTEEQLQVRLFERNAKGLTLTYAGEHYIQYASNVLALERSFDQELCDIQANRKGRIRIGTSPHIGSIVLPEVLPDFQKRYPNIDVEIVEGTSLALEEMINRNEADLVLMHLPLKNCQGNAIPIQKDRYVMVFSANNPLAQKIYYKPGIYRPFIDPSLAKDQQFVLSHPYQRVRQISDRILEQAGIVPKIRLETSSVQTALRFSGFDMGVTFMPESYISLFNIRKSTIFCYLEDAYHADWTLSLVYPKDNVLTAPLRLFVNLTNHHFGNISDDPYPIHSGI